MCVKGIAESFAPTNGKKNASVIMAASAIMNQSRPKYLNTLKIIFMKAMIRFSVNKNTFFDSAALKELKYSNFALLS